MKPLSLKEILAVIDADSLGITQDIIINQVEKGVGSIQSNSVLFYLDKRQSVDWAKLELNPTCYLLSSIPPPGEKHYANLILVDDVEVAYWKFITYYRQLFDIPVVAVTGTCGKSTTKEIIRQILERRFKVQATRSSVNALGYDHGYLLGIEEDTEIAVFETAVSNPGDLLYGCRYFAPTLGVITNIGIDHLQGCKTLDKYISTKAEILAGLNNRGTLILNADDENIKKIDLSSYTGSLVYFGIEQDAEFGAKDIRYHEQGMYFTLRHHEWEYDAFIPGYGRHNVYNALAAVAVLHNLGLSHEDIIADLSHIAHIRSHLQVLQGPGGCTILDDTWSSNPTSIRAALEVLHELGHDKKKIAVLGKISLLGNYAKEQYQSIGNMALAFNLDCLITKGSFAGNIAKNAVQVGMDQAKVFRCSTADEIRTILKSLLDPDTIVLFKTSQYDKSMKRLINDLID